MILNRETITTTEGSDSNHSNRPGRPNKCQRYENAPTTSRFKGVVMQQNGNWGAQIYANQQRIWLGTFKSEKAASMAYDSAAIKLRNGDSHRNFPWTNLTIQEPNFQNLYSTEVVLSMIKDGSYESKFTDFVRTQSSKMVNGINFDMARGHVDEEGLFCQQIFQKELTPSDVGKLNRLVIPKKHAIKYFPHVSKASIEGYGDSNSTEDSQLVFLDRQLRSWKFRYCYWKSSQSFVFTRGWNRFVKEKELKARDVVTFYKCEHNSQGFKEVEAFCMIDVTYNSGDSGENGLVAGFIAEGKVKLQLGLGGWFGCGPYGDEKMGEEGEEEEEREEAMVAPPPGEKKVVRLFGVQIS
ncbi:AP2/ERF and B3 domain-containing transcription factor At1g50680-like [Tasmannia lanceolata]|uniref:AP2/ERF and B3 domain-containing transcription factor At1g50680-like n=1 Tax=Tasmannia lanceolata TaxID=3420 RepID=UPI00406463EE